MTMNLERLKWLAIALPLAFVVFLWITTESLFGYWYGGAIFMGALAAGVFFFATVIFGWLDRSQKASDARARELQALNDLGRQLTGSLNQDAIVSLVLESASSVLSARAVGVSFERDETLDWRAAGEWKDELQHAVAERTPDDARGNAIDVLGNGGRAAVLLSAPMDGAHTRGVLHALLDADTTEPLTSVRRLMHGLANHATAALDRCRLFEDIQRREQRTRALYDVGLEIVSAQDLSRVLQQVTGHACRLVGARAAALCLVNETDGGLSLVETAGDTSILFASNGAGHENGKVPVVIGAGQRRGHNPLSSCPLLAEPRGEHSIRAHLIVGSNVVGELCVVHEQHRRFTEDERALLASLADMAAIAIHNSRLLERERQVAVLEERDHLAREMHDTLAQVLGYLHLKAATTRKRLESGELGRASEELQEMQDLAHEAYVDVREAILGLRETVAPAGGIVGSLRQYLQKFGRQSGIDARLFVPSGVGTGLAPEAEIQLLRVVQEALTNVRKHAEATTAAVRIENEGNSLRVLIEDDGHGFDSSKLNRDEGRSFGLSSMRERVERAGGRLSIDSAPGSGTRIVVLLPLNEGGSRHVAYEGSAG